MSGYLIRRVKDPVGDGNVYFLKTTKKKNTFSQAWRAKKFATRKEAWKMLDAIKEYGVDYEIVHDHTLEPINAKDEVEDGNE